MLSGGWVIRTVQSPSSSFVSSCARSIRIFASPPATFRPPPRPPLIAPRAMSDDAAAATKVWDGRGMSQDDFMKKDMCVLVNQQDKVIGHASKYDAHRFEVSPGRSTPHGLLHRAFSVFLFDSKNRLLLQQRALDKITFPGVWTNTCCSHQLYGYEPCEVDTETDIKTGVVPGCKYAAVRKLGHELGIPQESVPVSDFIYMTRLHYCAPDTDSGLSPAVWGEHEMDYILLIKADVHVQRNPEEVEDTKYVTLGKSS